MESQRPPVSCSATPPQQSQPLHQLSTNTSPDEYNYAYNEKEPYQRQQTIRIDRHSKSSFGRGHDSVISHPFSPKASSAPSPCSSISSIGQQRNSTAEIRYSSRSEIERGSIQYPQQAHLDPEKHGYGSSQGRRSPNRVSAAGPDGDAIVYDKGAYHEKGPEEKAWQLLFWLCGPCAFLSGAIALWTIFALLISLALAPLRFCTKRPSFSEQITAFLAPALNLQLHLVYSHDSTTGYSAPMLVVIHLFSPIVAFGVAIAAWTAAGFWFFSLILGDPGGHDGHNDGKESIVGVRNWWERWLSRGLRETHV
ncbi:uncharacterized protein J4E92_003437 [Alternaria infectoria]|uniref:uncharacterized protein n=1 Tax=Alternaria metachromatica TaxID=283354 RepID=UPI0020C5290D|nr:uncharacterized protein J4E83_003928 [Alternaria metachromatica]XP_049214258.1 uncharacterized protein J4E79_002723 [Alternaria viburni]XP_049247909.1 uncharacterized protein J4E84_001924 [Alternaria hordeiaustralica]XP_051325254.1 uncharacterized protein J4E85_006809 [Alternaria conjuncta]XP_051355127.1 uncharacterized protein J4E92_003437 [Alternaria infectoria]KAI4625667.1 hypothetical protein J4E80_002799 [Alternaria sp. BMP 0032]KAI4626775.1 hypothetical protein J4E83_003928 [Alternar